ncbi:hypothetical protein EJ377_17935 [Chryseobacterium arthrosphaerae]|uniref:Uncharacterized protein n=1 Tax=Chryseobacterium arthrosphaerae TaxID=651561 RepID=A0A432DSZ7_9FLAO|nr:hypothetical protein EJ377_17935 [Chryseobacterium arthrosphaerae]
MNNPNAEFGEIEDYQLPVDLYDLGMLQLLMKPIIPMFLIQQDRLPVHYIYRNIVDEEQAAQSVAAGNDNNGTNGDGVDEDAY